MKGLDSLDHKLIELLEKDTQRSSEKLAKKLRVSPATVRRRIKRLIQNGVIHFMGVIDPYKAGLPVGVLVAMDVDHEKFDQVTEALAEHPSIRWVAIATGRFDVLAFARFPSNEELSSFLEKDLAAIEGIRDSETFFFLSMKKARYL